jgi:hypothetical protein
MKAIRKNKKRLKPTKDFIEICKAGITIPKDIILEILNHLSDFDKLNFLSTCKKLLSLRKEVTFNNLYIYENIKNLDFLDRFTRVRYVDINRKTKFPKNLTEISVIKPINLKYLPTSNRVQSVIISLVNTDLSDLLNYAPHCRKIVIKKIKLKTLTIPEGIEILRIDCIRMAKGKTIILPNSLKYLKIKDISRFNLDFLPDSIETLCIGSHKHIPNSEVPKLPSRLQVLHSRNIDLSRIPNTVHTLKLLHKFRKDMSIPLPDKLKYLETDVYIKLPKYLESLKLRPEYSRSEDKRILNIPPTIKQLVGYYNSDEMSLYDSLEYLNIHFHVSDSLKDEELPTKLRTFYAFIQEFSVIHSFPETLEEIGLFYRHYYPLNDPLYTRSLPNFPQGLRKLELNGIEIVPDFPEFIEYLVLHDVEYIPELPKKLKYLDLSNIKNLPELPESLETLKIKGEVFPKKFPSNLKSLTLKSANYLRVPNSISELNSLEFLFLHSSSAYNLQISPKFSFPESIKELHIDVGPIPEYICLPPNLRKLTIGRVRHQLELPKSITHLKIHYNCTEPITLPPCLKYLEILSDLGTIAIKDGVFPNTLEVLVFKVKKCNIMPILPLRLRELHTMDQLITDMNVYYPKRLEILHIASNRSIPKTLPEYTEVLRKRNDIKDLESVSWTTEREILEYR